MDEYFFQTNDFSLLENYQLYTMQSIKPATLVK